ncbi:uncharacterized protein LOC129263472 isoform X2 [Lytechinus pictus]|uniref:uncharacterized protein LOC129263472 isoform X2 n=1 Tax=Lytechinus pictus TaxID=7653 RepID=UPI0030B9F0E5
MNDEMTTRLWNCLRSFNLLTHLIISDSSLSFPPSPPQLLSVTALSAKRVTSQCYEGLISSLPRLVKIHITTNNAEGDIHQITAGLRRTGGQRLDRIILRGIPLSFPPRHVVRPGLLFGRHTDDTTILKLDGSGEMNEEGCVELLESLAYLASFTDLQLKFLDGWSFNFKTTFGIEISQYNLGNDMNDEMTTRLWNCLRSFNLLTHLIISDSSLSFPPSPPQLLSVTALSAKRVTSQCYEGLISSLPGLVKIDITTNNAEGDIHQITAGLRRTGGQRLDRIILRGIPLSFPPRHVVRPGLLFGRHTDDTTILKLDGSGEMNEEGCVELLESLAYLASFTDLQLKFLDGWSFNFKTTFGIEISKHKPGNDVNDEMTIRLWSCLRSFNLLTHLSISDSSLSFPPSPPQLLSVTALTAERVTSQCYEGLISSLPGLEDIDIAIDDAEGDIPQITAGLRRTGGQNLTRIKLCAPQSISSENKSISRETVRGLGLLIRQHTKNLQWIGLSGVIGLNEEDLAEFLESSTSLASLAHLNLECLHSWCFNFDELSGVQISKHKPGNDVNDEMTIRLWNCLRSFNLLTHLSISDSSLSFPPSPPQLLSVTELTAERVTSQCYEGLISSLPGLEDIDIAIDDAEGDIPQITAGLRRTGGQNLTRIKLCAPQSISSENRSVSRETVRGLGLLIRQHTKNLQWIGLSGVIGLNEEDLAEFLESSTSLASLAHLNLECLHSWCFNFDELSGVQITKCCLSSDMTTRIWSCLRSFTSLNHLRISDSLLSFSLSPPELPSVTKLSANKLTLQCYKGLISSLPGLQDIDVQDAARDDFVEFVESSTRFSSLLRLEIKTLDEWHFDFDIAEGVQITKCHLSSEMTARMWSCLRPFTSLNHLTISDSSLSFSLSPPELPSVTKLLANKLTSQCYQGLIPSLPGLRDIEVQDAARDDFVDFVESSIRLTSLQRLKIKSLDKWQFDFNTSSGIKITKCRLSSEMTSRMWPCLRSFTSLKHLTISDSSLIFSSSPPSLPSVTKLSAERVTSQCYEGLISSLTGLVDIDITVDVAEEDISHITAGLHRTGEQKLKSIYLHGPSSLSPERSRVSSKTMIGLGLVIKEHTQNLNRLHLRWVKCTNEDDLVYLIECCRRVKMMQNVLFFYCGTTRNGRLQSHLEQLHRGSSHGLNVHVYYENVHRSNYRIPLIDHVN